MLRMDLAAGPTAPDLAPAALIQGARRYDFYQLIELLHRHHDDDLERSEQVCPGRERVRYSASASLGFPSSDVVALEQRSSGKYALEISFFGLQGAQSPLPGYYLESLAHEAAHQEGVARDFLDFFHHRLLTLVHRSWRKYRHYVRYQDGASDGFSAAVFALVGLADEELRVETLIPWGKMLAYAGLLAGRSRSPEVVCSVVGHCFDLDRKSTRLNSSHVAISYALCLPASHSFPTRRSSDLYVRYQDGASDGFSAAVFALVGLADEELRVETLIPWGKMLAYAGLLAGRSRSPEVVCSVVGHCFD